MLAHNMPSLVRLLLSVVLKQVTYLYSWLQKYLMKLHINTTMELLVLLQCQITYARLLKTNHVSLLLHSKLFHLMAKHHPENISRKSFLQVFVNMVCEDLRSFDTLTGHGFVDILQKGKLTN